MKSLTQKIKIWCNNAVSRSFGKYSFYFQHAVSTTKYQAVFTHILSAQIGSELSLRENFRQRRFKLNCLPKISMTFWLSNTFPRLVNVLAIHNDLLTQYFFDTNYFQLLIRASEVLKNQVFISQLFSSLFASNQWIMKLW